MTARISFPVPASMLKSRAREKELELNCESPQGRAWLTAEVLTVAEQLGWGNILGEFEFPIVHSWPADQAPSEVMDQLIGQTIGFGMRVKYQGEDCLVVDLDICPQELGQKMTPDHLDQYWRPITLVPAKYFDLDT